MNVVLLKTFSLQHEPDPLFPSNVMVADTSGNGNRF